MKHPFISPALAIAALISLNTFEASAKEPTIRNLPKEGSVTISGIVQDIQSEREFTLKDASGKIDVSIESNQSTVIAKGDDVTVTGKIESSVMGKYIAASSVDVKKGLSASLSDAIEGHTSISLDNAKKEKISNLPDEGLVKITGTVEDVDDEKNFTVKDSTGEIDVAIESEENAVITKGAAVTVIGYVDRGLLSKNILAKRVIVTADAGDMAPAAGSSAKPYKSKLNK